MKADKIFKYGSIILSGLGLIAIYAGVHMIKKAKKAIDTVNGAIDSLADKTKVEVSNEIVEKAAEKAADKAAEKAIETVRKDINTRVYNTVSSAYKNVEEDAEKKLAKAIEKDVDMDELKRKIENRASSAVVDKFITDLDDYMAPIMNHVMNAMDRRRSKNESKL